MAGDNADDRARADMIVDCCQDLGMAGNAIFKETDPDKKVKIKVSIHICTLIQHVDCDRIYILYETHFILIHDLYCQHKD